MVNFIVLAVKYVLNLISTKNKKRLKTEKMCLRKNIKKELSDVYVYVK